MESVLEDIGATSVLLRAPRAPAPQQPMRLHHGVDGGLREAHIMPMADARKILSGRPATGTRQAPGRRQGPLQSPRRGAEAAEPVGQAPRRCRSGCASEAFGAALCVSKHMLPTAGILPCMKKEGKAPETTHVLPVCMKKECKAPETTHVLPVCVLRGLASKHSCHLVAARVPQRA